MSKALADTFLFSPSIAQLLTLKAENSSTNACSRENWDTLPHYLRALSEQKLAQGGNSISSSKDFHFQAFVFCLFLALCSIKSRRMSNAKRMKDKHSSMCGRHRKRDTNDGED